MLTSRLTECNNLLFDATWMVLSNRICLRNSLVEVQGLFNLKAITNAMGINISYTGSFSFDK